MPLRRKCTHFFRLFFSLQNSSPRSKIFIDVNFFLNKTLLTYNFRTLKSRYFRPPLLKTGSRWARDFRAADRIVTSNLQRVFLAFCVFLAHLEEMSSISEEEFSEFTSGDWWIRTLLRIFRWAYWFYNSRLCAIWRKFGANCDWKRSCRICRGSRPSRRRRADAFKSVFYRSWYQEMVSSTLCWHLLYSIILCTNYLFIFLYKKAGHM